MNIRIAFVLIFFTFLSAQQDDFFKGNHLFEQGQYAQACHAYKSIENPGFAVLYNTALSYLYQGNQAQALLAIKRAEQQANFHQLTILYELVDWMELQNDPDYVVTLPGQLAIFLKKCILSISMLFLLLLILILLVGIIVVWYRRWYYRHALSMASLVIVFMMVGELAIYKLSLVEDKIGIVTKDAIFLYAGPDRSFYKKAQLHSCDEVIIGDRQQGYFQVVVLDRRQKHYQASIGKRIGWVSDDDIELVSTLK
jgi:hypothetical protein